MLEFMSNDLISYLLDILYEIFLSSQALRTYRFCRTSRQILIASSEPANCFCLQVGYVENNTIKKQSYLTTVRLAFPLNSQQIHPSNRNVCQICHVNEQTPQLEQRIRHNRR